MARGKSAGASLALWLALAALVVVLDQFTKQLILGNYQPGDSTYVTSFFNIVRAHNTGAAFSFLGGAVGNVIDRLMHGYVVDFLDFHWSFLSPMFYRGHFPAFNVADAAITAGAIGLILDELLRVRRGR